MSAPETCSGASLAAEEQLAATATERSRWLLVEVRRAWGRDALEDTALEPGIRDVLDAHPGTVLLVRRPDRRQGVTVVDVTASEDGGTARWQELESAADLLTADLAGGDPMSGPIVLVCAHGRRDACCARFGPPLYEALLPEFGAARLWQSSHLGGHRFAPNVLVLPQGIQLGRIPLERASEVARLLDEDRIPLDLYRGRTLYPRAVQAAEVFVRSTAGLDGIGDLRLVSHEDDLVTFSTPAGELAVRVEERPGPLVPASCGAEPEPTSAWAARLESAT